MMARVWRPVGEARIVLQIGDEVLRVNGEPVAFGEKANGMKITFDLEPTDELCLCELVDDGALVWMAPEIVEALDTLAHSIEFGDDYPDERDAQQILRRLLEQVSGEAADGS